MAQSGATKAVRPTFGKSSRTQRHPRARTSTSNLIITRTVHSRPSFSWNGTASTTDFKSALEHKESAVQVHLRSVRRRRCGSCSSISRRPASAALPGTWVSSLTGRWCLAGSRGGCRPMPSGGGRAQASWPRWGSCFGPVTTASRGSLRARASPRAPRRWGPDRWCATTTSLRETRCSPAGGGVHRLGRDIRGVADVGPRARRVAVRAGVRRCGSVVGGLARCA